MTASRTPVDADRDAEAMRRLEGLADLLDTAIAVPGTNFRVGLDGLVGLIPGIGDAVTTIVSAYILLEGYRMGVSSSIMSRMLVNWGLDSAIGSVPVVGDIFDMGFKANRRNVDLIRRHFEDVRRESP